MLLTIRDVEAHELDSWDDFVYGSSQGTLFHTSTYQRFIGAVYPGARLRLIGAFDRGGVVGGCALLDRFRFGQRTAVTPLLTPYTGFILAGSVLEGAPGVADSQNILSQLAEFLSREYKYQSLVNAPGLDDMRPLLARGYSVTPRYTFEMNLQLAPEELWMGFQGHVRRHVKKAEKLEIEVMENIDSPSAFSMFQQTFARHKEECPISQDFLEEMVQGPILRDYRRNFCAYLHGEMISFITTLRFRDRVYYALASTAENQMQTGISSYLVWEVLRDYARSEYKAFDFVGANVPSIARFKSGFGPEVRMYFAVETATGLHVKLGREIRRLLKR